MGEGRPYLVYCAVSTQEGEGAPLESVTEDYLLVLVKTQTTSEDLGRYSSLAGSEPVRQGLAAFLRARDDLQALFSQKAETLFSLEKWVGAPERTGEDIALYFVIDLTDPLSLVALELLGLAQRASHPYHRIQTQAVLLALEGSPYIYPVLQEVWQALQGPAPLLSRGAFLIEKENEWGNKGTEEERLAAVVEWLERVVNDRLPYHEDMEQPKLGSWGMAQGIVPRERLNRFFALRWGSEFLKGWTLPDEELAALSAERIAKWWGQIEPLVQKPVATATTPPNYATEVQGSLAPSTGLQQENARLYSEGRLPRLSDRILSDIQTEVSTQESHKHPIFLRNLKEISKEVLRQAQQILETQIQEVFGRSRHPFAENLAFLDQTLHRFEESRKEAENQIAYLNELEQQGLFQERLPEKPSLLVQIWCSFLFVLVGLMTLEGLFWGGRNLLILWPLVKAQPLPFLGIVGLLIALAALVFYDVRVILKRKGVVIVFLVLPLELVFRDLVLWNVLFNVGLNLLLLLLQLWPKFQLYELNLIGQLRRIDIADNYQQAKSYAENALTRFNTSLLIYRFFVLVAICVVLLIQAYRIQGRGFWDLWATFPSNWPRWLWPLLSLAAVFLSKYFFMDVIGAEARRATGRLIILTEIAEWGGGLLRLTLIGWVVAIAISLYLNLSTQEWITMIEWAVVFTLVFLARYTWEYFNDRERLTLLVREWVEWHERMAFLRFHLETWQEAGRFYNRFLEEIQALKQELEQWWEALEKEADEKGQLAEEEARALEKDIQERRFPRYVMTKTLEEFYDDFLQEAGADLEGRLIREHGVQLWTERPDAAAVDRVLAHFIGQTTQTFWREQDIVRLLGPNPDITWMLKPAHPFWTCTNIKAPRKAYLGLPPQVEHEYEEHYKARISSKFGLVDPTTGKRTDPTRFEEDPWTITVLYYRYGVSPNELSSLSEWKKVYEDELRRLEESSRASIPEAVVPPEKPSLKDEEAPAL
jgi:hypothetical protein